MKMQELNKKEQQLINGGNTFSTQSSVSISNDTLLSLTYQWKYGDKEGKHTLEIGKGIDFSLSGYLGNSTA